MSRSKDNAYELLRNIHNDIHEDDTYHNSESFGICKKKPKQFLDNYIDDNSQKFLAYNIISLAVIAVIIYILSRSISNYIFYSSDSGFPDWKIFIGGTIITVGIVTYIAYKAGMSIENNRNWIYISYIVFCITYPLWVINLALRLEYYVKGQPVESNGSMFLILSTLSLLSIFIALGCNSSSLSIMLLIPIIWNLYITYQWWFRERSKGEQTKWI